MSNKLASKLARSAPMTSKYENAILISSKTMGTSKTTLTRTYKTAAVSLPRRTRSGFLLPQITMRGGSHMTEKLSLRERLPRYYWSIVMMGMALFITFQPVYANIWTTFSNIMKDIYGQLLGISTIVAVTAAAVALIIRMVSRNQRAVDEATSWLKRILVTWLILNTLGFIIAYIQPLIQGGQYTP